MAWLRILSGELKHKIVPLETDSVVLGRDSAVAPLIDEGMSRQHAEVFRAGELFLIRDLGSRNGTFVNGDKVDEWVLRAGDRVLLGNTKFAFEDRFSRPEDSRVLNFAHTAELPESTLSIPLRDVEEYSAEHRRLEVLYKVCRILGTGEESADAMRRVARTLSKALRADHVYLFAFGGTEEDPEFRFVAGHDKSPVEDLVVSNSILARVRTDGRPILSSDAMLDDRFASSQSVVLRQIKSLLCVPLTVQNRTVGAFYACNSKLSEVFSAEDLELATIIGMVVGNSVETWELLDRQGSVYRSVLTLLSEITEIRTPNLRGRGERVATFAAAISRALGYSDEKTEKMWIAGLLHDLGALGVSDEDLKGALFLEAKKAKKAAEFLEQLPELNDVAPAIRLHTERLDGSGFPEGLSGDDQVPEEAQVVGLARCLDDLLTLGEDGRELSNREALDRIRGLAPTQFSETVVNGLLRAYRRGRLFQGDAPVFKRGI